jgi:hypothetical protein
VNERIRLLADEAGFIDSWFSESGDNCERELKKFAQLLVEECINICISNRHDDSAEHIEEHFGVEL